MKYFAYSPDTGFDLYETAEKAKAAAFDSINEYRFRADDGWEEDVENVCWGEVKQETVACNEQPSIGRDGVSIICDYELADVDPPNTSICGQPQSTNGTDSGLLQKGTPLK